MLNLVDYFGGTMLIFALAMFEMVALFWIYGKQFIKLLLFQYKSVIRFGKLLLGPRVYDRTKGVALLALLLVFYFARFHDVYLHLLYGQPATAYVQRMGIPIISDR